VVDRPGPAGGQDGGMTAPDNLLAGPPPTLLPEEPAAAAALAAGDPAEVAARYPAYSAAWAALADRAYAAGSVVESYAYARTGYHRGLDALRRNGWKGHGPIPWAHRPNQGFLRALHALGRAAGDIGETAEADRCLAFLRDSDPAAEAALAG
jgi:Protein of unknown function (DUF3151)